MKKHIILILIFASVNLLYSIEYKDSLLNIIKTTKDNNSKVQTAKNLARHIATMKPDSADYYIKLFEKTSKKYGNKDYQIESSILKSLKYAYLGDLSRSNEMLLQAIDFSIKNDNLNKLDEIYLTLGINNLRLGVYDESIYYLNKSLEIAKQNQNNDMLGRLYITIGIFFNKQNNFKKEQSYLFKALEIFQKEENLNNLSTVYSNIGSNYLKFNKIDSAKYFLKKAQKIDSLSGDLQGLAVVLHNLGGAFDRDDDLENTVLYLNKSIELKEQLNNSIGIGVSRFALAEAYVDDGYYNKAKEQLNKSIEIFKKSKALRILSLNYSLLDTINFLQNNFEEAYKYSKLSQELQDSIYNERKQEIISDYESKYELAEKEKDNEVLRRKSEKQQLTIIIVLLIVMLVGVIIIILYIRHRALEKINKEINEKNEKINKQNEELELLNQNLTVANNNLIELNATKDKFFSIISHDLKGPISSSYQVIDSIRSYYDSFSEDEKKEYFDLLFESTYNTYLLLENLLTWSRSQREQIKFIAQKTDVKELADITISHLKSNADQKSIAINNLINPKLELKLDANMISTVFRNLINNSIKYSKENGKIDINSKESEKGVIFTVSDNGIGMDEEIKNSLFKIEKSKSREGTKNEKGTGLGLIIVKEFIDKHNGNIWVESEPDKGSTFYISIPNN